MKIKPLNDRVLVKVKLEEEKTSGGIFIPQTAQEKTQQGTVLAIGDSKDITVKVNDEIIYDKYAGTTIKLESDEQLVIKAQDILAVITK